MIGHGSSCARSYSAAAGRMTSRANAWVLSRSASCSSVSATAKLIRRSSKSASALRMVASAFQALGKPAYTATWRSTSRISSSEAPWRRAERT